MAKTRQPAAAAEAPEPDPFPEPEEMPELAGAAV